MMPDRLTVRRAEPADADLVHALVRALATEQGPLSAATATADRWRELLADPHVLVLVAEIGGQAAGFVSAVASVHLWSGRELLAVDDLYVVPDRRRSGIGTLLMTALAAERNGSVLRWEVDEGRLSLQGASLRLGAHLRRKVVAMWTPPPLGTGQA